MTLEAFVHRTFPPLIGSFTSQLVDEICLKNNLTFVQLVQPFCQVFLDYSLKDPSGTDLYIKNLKVCVKDVNEQPPATGDARRLFHEAVADSWCDVTKLVRTAIAPLDIPDQCPWFDAWTDTFLHVQYPSEHEFTKHLLGCILVTSADDTMETVQAMLEKLRVMQTPLRLPKWFCPAIFKFHVIIHDSQSHNKEKTMKMFDSFKPVYGIDNCFLLEINSREEGENDVSNYWMDINTKPLPVMNDIPSVPESNSNDDSMICSDSINHPLSFHQQSVPDEKNPKKGYGYHLSVKDVGNVQEMIRMVVRNALLPHVEKQIYILNDLVANKKGVSRSLLSATKRLFGSPRPVPGNTQVAGFSADAPELQLRRLGDLYFLFGSYANAFQAYYAAKRELGMEQAWLYYAGALEMAALAASLMPDPPKKATEYAEEAIAKYMSLRQTQQFATRATLLSVHCLRQRGMYAEAARQLTRMSSEETDLRSALFLEQAAYCLLSDKKPRKYAMHMVLAAHRYTKALQQRHALRCARQALQIYDGRGWALAEDHIYWTIGLLTGQLHRQRFADARLLPEGLRALSQLLVSCSRQEASQQANYLLEFLNMYQAWQTENRDNAENLVKLPLPIVEENSVSVRIAHGPILEKTASSGDTPEEAARWGRMEELALAETSTGVPMIFRPSLPVLTNSLPNPQGLVVAVNERIQVCITLKNPLHISLPLSQIALLWKWTGPNGESSPDESAAKSEELAALLIPPDALHVVTLSVIPRRHGILQITGFVCSLTSATSAASGPVVRGWHELTVRGPKLRPPKDKPDADCYAEDKRLHITILPAAPFLTAPQISFRLNVLSGEIKFVPLDLTNSGNMAIKSLYAVTDAGGMLALPQNLSGSSKFIQDGGINYQVMQLKSGIISPSGTLPMELWVRSPDTAGPVELRMLLLYYGDAKHRVLRVTLRLQVSSGLQISATLTSRPDQQGLTATTCISAANHHVNAVTLVTLALASAQHSLESLPHYSTNSNDLSVNHLEKCYLVYRVTCSSEPRNLPTVSLVKFNEFEKNISDAIVQLLLSLATMQRIILGVLWQTSANGIMTTGLSLIDVDVQSLKIEEAPSMNSNYGQNVVLYLSHSDRVVHSFAKSRLCLVKVDVSVVSSCTREMRVHLNAAGQEGSSSVEALLYTPHAGTAFTWAGRARAAVSVPPLGKATVTMLAAFAAPGTYDLAVRFTATLNDTPLPPPATSPLVVINEDR